MRPNVAQADLDHVLEHTSPVWAELRGERLLLTGGTGFFGRWLVESFLYANRALGLGSRLVVLSRNPGAFEAAAPHLCADPSLRLIQGDVRSFRFPAGRFGFLIHAATESIVAQETAPEQEYATIVEGTQRVLEFASAAGVRRMLLVSSGAVYGSQPATVSHLEEGQRFAACAGGYALGKRAAEAMCGASGVPCTVARGFAFVGPHLRLDAHFAVGNFLRDALAGRAIQVRGDGTAVRSYLYAADLAVWLWTILLKGAAGRPYNVGSEEPVSVAALAERVAAGVAAEIAGDGAAGTQAGGRVEVRVGTPTGEQDGAGARYVPSTGRARAELGLEAWIGLDEAIRRTAAWHRGFARRGVSG